MVEVITLGRISVDLYPEEIRVPLPEVPTDDPAYQWIRATCDDMPPDPRVPMIDARGPQTPEESTR